MNIVPFAWKMANTNNLDSKLVIINSVKIASKVLVQILKLKKFPAHYADKNPKFKKLIIVKSIRESSMKFA